MLAIKLLWTAHNRSSPSKKAMNSVSMVHNFRPSCFSFAKNCFNNKKYRIAFFVF